MTSSRCVVSCAMLQFTVEEFGVSDGRYLLYVSFASGSPFHL